MNLYRIKKVTDVVSYIAIVIGVIISGKALYDRFTLPPNVCPINDNTTMIYFGLIILISSIILSSIVDHLYKKKTQGVVKDKEE